MKENFAKIKEMFEKMKSGKISYEKKGVRPSKDWKIMLSTTFWILLISASFAVYFYLKVDNGEIFSVSINEAEKDVEINAKLLKKIVQDIDTRVDFIEQLKKVGQVPGDPSR